MTVVVVVAVEELVAVLEKEDLLHQQQHLQSIWPENIFLQNLQPGGNKKIKSINPWYALREFNFQFFCLAKFTFPEAEKR